MADLGLLILRLVAGPLLAGHGAQKLFGWFGGYGPKGTGDWLESLGFRPGRVWALVVGLSEFTSGVLAALGLFHPLGSIFTFGPMSVAMGKVHWGKPIWVTEGGGELPVTNMAIAASLALVGPGKLSLDHLLGIRLPRPLVALAAVGTAVGIAVALSTPPAPAPQAEERAGAEPAGAQREPAATIGGEDRGARRT